MKKILILLLIASTISPLAPVLAHSDDDDSLSSHHMMDWFFKDASMNLGWLGMFFTLSFWVLVFLVMFFLVRWIATNNWPKQETKSALDILKKRYAKGEIDKKEFEEKKKDLS